METKSEKEDFSFTYSAKEQDEVRRIRQKYQLQEEDKMMRLRKLDASVTQKANMVSIAIGTVGALVLGSGMSLIMTDLGRILGFQGVLGMILGIIIGVIGIIFVGLAYPVYNRIVRKERERIAPEILRLTEELMK